MSDFFLRYVEKLKSVYPTAGQLPDLEDRLKLLISSQVLTLPKSVLERVDQTIRNVYDYAHRKDHLKKLQEKLPAELNEILSAPAKNAAVLMAYDFHYDPKSDALGLIEINTNASAFLFADLLYKIDTNTSGDNSLNELNVAFKSELDYSNKKIQGARIAVIDEKISEQKMYLEFLMYKDLFLNWGCSAELQEFDLCKPKDFDLIYNRYTDFTFSDPRSLHLRSAYLKNETIFSPHPREYLLLADKDRLQDFSEARLSPSILNSFPIQNYTDPEGLWEQRKKLFFKPAQMYGGKAVYRGSSISRRMFNEILERNYIAQEFSPPGEWDGWKYDLRFYAYKDRIQLTCARLYHGQVTGFSAPGGGLARVIFK